MNLATAGHAKPPWQYWTANDTVEPIHDMGIPILPFKQPPNRFDYEKLPQRKRNQQQEKNKKDDRKDPNSGDEFHIDDYA